jgi:hypothetical protein
VCNLLGHTDSDGGGIVAADAKQNHETGPDFSRDATLHGYARAAYTLDNGSHFRLKRICAVGPASSVLRGDAPWLLLARYSYGRQPPALQNFLE